MNDILDFILEIGTTPIALLIIIAVTVVSNVINQINSKIAFITEFSYLSLGALIIEVFFVTIAIKRKLDKHDEAISGLDITGWKSNSEENQEKVSESMKSIDKKLDTSLEYLKDYDCIRFGEMYKLNEQLKKLIRDRNSKTIEIICYGTGHFGGIIDAIVDEEIDINVKMIMYSFSEQVEFCGYDFSKDKNDLFETAKFLENRKKFEVKLCKIFPTIRACRIISQSGETIFCMLQPYLIDISKNTFHLMSNSGMTPLIMADNKNKNLLDNLNRCFTKYYETFDRQSRTNSEVLEEYRISQEHEEE